MAVEVIDSNQMQAIKCRGEVNEVSFAAERSGRFAKMAAEQ